MRRYFFDLVDQKRSELDFRGRELPNSTAALRLAELIAIDESMLGERLGWQVRVADPVGNQLFSVPVVQCPELMAA